MSTVPAASGEAALPPATSLPLNALFLLFDKIALHLPLSSVINLSQTHPLLLDKPSTHLCQSFDELLALRISKPNVNAFRDLLLTTRAVISGSTVLHFILRESHWMPGDFDLYAPFGTGYAVVHWLVTHEGYKIVSDGSKSFIFHPHVVKAPAHRCDWLTDLDPGWADDRRPWKTKTTYESRDADIYRVYKLCSTNNTFIDVIESAKPSFLPPITKFHSTLVMNYLTPEHLVVLYPRLTLKREGVLQFRDENTLESYDNPNLQSMAALPIAGRKQDYFEKYKSRGFTLFARPADLFRRCGAACPSLCRRISSDQYDTWTLRIKIAKPTRTSFQTTCAALPPDPIAPVAFPDISDESAIQTRDIVPTASPSAPSDSSASGSPPPSSSWSSSYVADFSDELASLTIVADSGTQPCASIPTAPRRLRCTRPPLPDTSWTLRAPLLSNETRANRKQRVRSVCQNPYCLMQGQHPGLHQPRIF